MLFDSKLWGLLLQVPHNVFLPHKTPGHPSDPRLAGPSAYNTGSLVGSPSKLSTQANVPSPKIGTKPRFKNWGEGPAGAALPGPGQYGRPTAAIESHIASLPAVGFAKANRDANKKVRQ